MGIARFEAWGEPGPLPAGGVIVRSDAEARAVVEQARRRNEDLPVLGLLGGDLCRTLGGRGDEARLHSESAMRLPVDVGSVLIDGRLHWFVAHLIARRSWWRGRVVAVMNAEWLGAWSLGPRSHPGDGLLDISEGDLSFADRLKARRRLVSGDHLAHPDIRTERVRARQFDFDPALDIWLDGERVGRARALSVRVEAAVLTVVV